MKIELNPDKEKVMQAFQEILSTLNSQGYKPEEGVYALAISLYVLCRDCIGLKDADTIRFFETIITFAQDFIKDESQQ